MRLIPIFILLAFAIGLPTSHSFAASTTVGTVKYVRGTAVAIRVTEEVKLHKGDPIFEGDLLKTSARSSLFAAMGGDKNNSIRMGQKSKLEVKEYSVSAGEVLGGFLRGIVGIFSVELNKLRKGNEFSMHTPTAVLGVRGTVWGSVVKADGSTTFAVKRGAIEVRMGGKKILLKKGQSVSVSKSGTVSPVTPTPKALEDAIDSDGSTFDNAAEEAAALAAAEAEALAAAEALAEAAAEAVALAEAAELASAEAEANPDDIDAQEKAAELAAAAEEAANSVVVAAEISTDAKDKANSAEDTYKKADAGVPIVSGPSGSGSSNQGAKADPTSGFDPTAGFQPGAAGNNDTQPATNTTTSKPTGGGAPASPS